MTPDQLHPALAELDAQSLRRVRRVLDGAQGARVILDGKPYLSFSSNDYLGLANHPAIATAAAVGLNCVQNQIVADDPD